MTAADPRVTAARAFLAAAKQRKFADRPNSVLVREADELRHQLGQVLRAIDDQAPAVLAGNYDLTGAEVLTVLSALAIAARWDDLIAGAAEDHCAGTGHASAYLALSRALGGDS